MSKQCSCFTKAFAGFTTQGARRGFVRVTVFIVAVREAQMLSCAELSKDSAIFLARLVVSNKTFRSHRGLSL